MAKSRRAPKADPAPQASTDVRLDKWLQVARIYKTRSQSTEAILAGHVKIGGRNPKASHALSVGDVIVVTKGRVKRELTVLRLAAKPIAKELARELYSVREEHESLAGLNEDQIEIIKRMKQLDRMHEASRKGQGRPTKKDRREIGKGKNR